MEPISTLGQILTRNVVTGEPHRDAIHIAIMPVILGEDHIRPGQSVKLAYGTSNQVLPENYRNEEAIGVIDPFLDSWAMPRKGDMVWLFLKPGSITGMRHQWTHPKIDNIHPPSCEGEKWLRLFAQKWNFDYDEMVVMLFDSPKPKRGA